MTKTTRIEETFKRLAAEKRSALVTYVMAYDPDQSKSLSLLQKLPEAGADIIELGMPFSDPMADGPIIQEAALRAFKAGAKLALVLEMVARFREHNTTTPVILMGYYNPLHHFGLERFVKQAKQVGVDGLLIVDLPPEEDDTLLAYTDQSGIALIKLVTPTTDANRLKTIIPKARGFIYYVSITGITGTASADVDSVKKAISQVKKHTTLPVVVGFGIKNADDIKAFKQMADGVVVGSSLVHTIAQSQDVALALKLVSQLRQAL